MKSLLVFVLTWAWIANLQRLLFIIEVEFAFFECCLSSIDSNQRRFICVSAWSWNDLIRIHVGRVVDCLRKIFPTGTEAEAFLGLTQCCARLSVLMVEDCAMGILIRRWRNYNEQSEELVNDS